MTSPAPVHAIIGSPLGDLTAVAVSENLVGLYFPGHQRRTRLPGLGALVDLEANPVLSATAQQLGEYFAGARTEFDLPLAPDGDSFQQRVWTQLRTIRYGETCTYGALARAIGQPGAAQAVGAANGANPISIVVPCHRVIGADGSLTGYAGGLDRKRFLLELEESEETKTARLW